MILFKQIFISVSFTSHAPSFTIRVAVTSIPRYVNDYANVKFGMFWPLNTKLSVKLLRFRFVSRKYDGIVPFLH
jgi:hypothetical protein